MRSLAAEKQIQMHFNKVVYHTNVHTNTHDEILGNPKYGDFVNSEHEHEQVAWPGLLPMSRAIQHTMIAVSR